MYSKCANCHRPGEVAPMSLLSYEDARPWAKAIKAKVVAREMPPWGADMTQTLPMRNDISLSQKEIDTIAAWVDGGARGQRRRHAAVAEVRDRLDRRHRARLHPRDAGRVRHSRRRRARRADVLFEGAVDGGSLRGDRRAEAEQPRRAASRRHFLRRHSRRRLARRRPHRRQGRQGRSAIAARAGCRRPTAACRARASCCRGCRAAASIIIAPNIGKRIPAGKYINWQLHYNPIGKPEKDRTRLGIWFNKVPVTHEVLIRQAGDPLATTKGGLSLYRAEGREVEYTADAGSTRRNRATPNIPPYAENWRLTGITPVTEDITLYAMSPHMHLRGKSLKWVIVYPDGREQTILNVPKFDFNWQFKYELEEPLKIPGRQQDPRARRLRQLDPQQVEPRPAPRGVLVGAELGRDVPAVHRILGRLAGPDRVEAGDLAAAAEIADPPSPAGLRRGKPIHGPPRQNARRSVCLRALAVLVAAFSITPAFAQEPTRVGAVSFAYIARSSKAGKDALAEIREVRQTKGIGGGQQSDASLNRTASRC